MKKFYFSSLILCLAGNLAYSQFIWTQMADYNDNGRSSACSFVLNSGGYVGCGFDSIADNKRSFSVYVPASNLWIPIQSLGNSNGGGLGRNCAVAFSINNKGYVGTGSASIPYLNDFWEYNPATDFWTQKANFVGTARRKAIGFSTATKGYIGLGQTATGFRNDLYEYDPIANLWITKASFPGTARQKAAVFMVGTIAYVGSGDDGVNKADFFQFNTATNVWSPIAMFPGSPRNGAAAFSMGGFGFFGCGYDNNLADASDFWQYNPTLNTWTLVAPFGGGIRSNMVAFGIGNFGYAGLGSSGPLPKKDFWAFGIGAGMSDDGNGIAFSVFPNPLTDRSRIVSAEEIETCRILDIKGALVREINEPGKDFYIEKSDLTAGVYFVELISGNQKGTKKLVVF